MSRKHQDAILRSDKIFVGALAVMLVAVSAAVGATAGYSPHTDKVRTKIVVVRDPAPAPVAAQERVPAGTVNAATPVAARPLFVSPSEQLVWNKLLAEHRCLSEVLYYEARGEGIQGQKAVAEVVFRRMRVGNYGHSICAVVYEGANRSGCQFSFTCNGDLRRSKASSAWMQAESLAARILTGEERLNDLTGGATSFHAISVQPDWASYLVRTVQIGNHIFYRDPGLSRAM